MNHSDTPLSPPPVTGIILAGGRATRMGGKDKGLMELAGRPLVAHALMRLQPQVADIVISANRNRSLYGRFGWPVVPDPDETRPGPLAGVAAAMGIGEHDYYASVPCDAPHFPRDLIRRLYDALQENDALCSVACNRGAMQPVFALYRKAARPAIERYLQAGESKVRCWHERHRSIRVSFDDHPPHSFLNINTEEQLRTAEIRLRRPPPANDVIE